MTPVTIQVYRPNGAEPIAGTKVHLLGDGPAALIEPEANPAPVPTGR
jgi:hypothetical protein